MQPSHADALYRTALIQTAPYAIKQVDDTQWICNRTQIIILPLRVLELYDTTFCVIQNFQKVCMIWKYPFLSRLNLVQEET